MMIDEMVSLCILHNILRTREFLDDLFVIVGSLLTTSMVAVVAASPTVDGPQCIDSQTSLLSPASNMRYATLQKI